MDNYQLAFDIALHTDQNLFVTGKAGTGKTTFLHRLKEATQKQIAVVAPTGVAAINAGGTTIHAFFQLPLSPFLPTPEGQKDLIARTKMRSQRRRVLQELELLVIDEISMVRSDLLDAIDASLRHFRRKPNQLFGGVQVIFIGDMFQLSPVVKDDEWRLLSQYYASPYFFHSQALQHNPPLFIEFDTIFRQTNSDFIKILNEIRNDCISIESLDRLTQRYNPNFTPSAVDDHIILTTHNYKADTINAEELAKLEGETFVFNAHVEGDYPERMFPADPVLELKVGARVMFLRNDTETPRRFYNGKIGVIDLLENDHIVVRCGDNDYIDLDRMVWENISYSLNNETKQIEEKVLGKFSQYPLRLAWAITIHKSQGLTFDKVVIDAGMAFASGQVYVALSRCRSLEGVVLLSRIQPENVYVDQRISEYEKSKMPAEMIEEGLHNARKSYRLRLLESVFDHSQSQSLIVRLLSEVEQKRSSFNEETIPYLQDINIQLQDAASISVKFQHQLRGLFRNQLLDEDFLKERLQAAYTYFSDRIDKLMQSLRKSPSSTDSRAHAAEYNEALEELFGELALKQHLLRELKSEPSIERFFEAKNRFSVPPFNVNAYAKSTVDKSGLTHPALYRLLVEVRDKLCDERNLPVYIVAGSKSLFEMAEYLPQNEDELLLISGFGPAKVERYGQMFLPVIRTYCEKHALSSCLSNKKTTGKEKKKSGKKKQNNNAR